MSIVAVTRPTAALSWTWATLEHILEDVARLRFEILVVVGTAKHGADALEVEAVAGLLLAEARVVDGPFFLCGRADVRVDAVGVFVEGDVVWGAGDGELGGDAGVVGSVVVVFICACNG